MANHLDYITVAVKSQDTNTQDAREAVESLLAGEMNMTVVYATRVN